MSTLHVAFRVDSSFDIGSGHLMRCLTLAHALREHGANSVFICRDHSGHRMDLIRRRGFAVTALPKAECEVNVGQSDEDVLAHASWLGCSWKEDATQTLTALAGRKPDWLVVDHYALDAGWERQFRRWVGSIMVIDDLADRDHDADLLLDQNLGRTAGEYKNRVPSQCMLLVGTQYALLRPEFAQLREHSLARRRDPELRELMISMGGVDFGNATARALDALEQAELPQNCHITVVMGGRSPSLDAVRERASYCRWRCDVEVDIATMALRTAAADLVVGAAGSASWERCCLGVPSLIAVLADNQRAAANALISRGAAIAIGDKFAALPALFGDHSLPTRMAQISAAASALVDGYGSSRVLGSMMEAI